MSKDTSKNTSQDKGYVKKIDKYQDLYSSAFTFFLVGGIGIVVLLLDLFGIISFNLAPNTKFLFYGVMTALFISFLIIAFHTSKTAKKVKRQIGEEITTTNEIINWFLGNYSAEIIDSFIGISEITSEELYYFKRSEEIERLLYKKLENPEAAFIDQLVEEIYQKFYE